MSYKSASGSLSETNLPNAEEKQIPKPINVSSFGQAIAPAKEIIQKRPTYVVIGGGSHTAYEFLYQTTCSVGGTSGETFTAALQRGSGSGHGPVRLDVQPVAWKGGGGTTGEVTFVYKGGTR